MTRSAPISIMLVSNGVIASLVGAIAGAAVIYYLNWKELTNRLDHDVIELATVSAAAFGSFEGRVPREALDQRFNANLQKIFVDVFSCRDFETTEVVDEVDQSFGLVKCNELNSSGRGSHWNEDVEASLKTWRARR